MDLCRDDIQMNDHDYAEYYLPAMNRSTPELVPNRTTQIRTFDKLLGVTLGEEFCRRPSVDDRPLPDDWREFLIQLSGPYSHPLLKAYRIKYKLEKAEHQNVKQD